MRVTDEPISMLGLILMESHLLTVESPTCLFALKLALPMAMKVLRFPITKIFLIKRCLRHGFGEQKVSFRGGTTY